MKNRQSRRRFLESLVVTAGGVIASTACGGDDGGAQQPGPGDVSYRFFPQSVASGDPRPDSVVLWTRVVDPELSEHDLSLELELSKDRDFAELVTLEGQERLGLLAAAAHDGCVKVRVTGLEPHSVYYYRFLYRRGEVAEVSATGRTKTAPADDDDVTLRFAVVSCQDFDGKYFHVLRHLVEQELDFVVHLGDYVYESGLAERPAGEARRVVFTKPDQALDLGGEGTGPYAARSLDNYRDLYRTVRQDPDLRRLHESLPMLAIPDDHEFSDDSHGATATYFDGSQDETDSERRRASDRAWFEFMPVDYAVRPARELVEDADFPDDFAIYRNFGFGRHLELVLTDLRRYRPDHLIPEDAFPGALFMTSADLVAQLVPAELSVPYVDVDEFEDGVYRDALRTAADALGFRPQNIRGNLSVSWINQQLETIEAAPSPIDADDASLERGLAYHQLLKTEEFSRIGSRYLVAQDPFDALAAHRFRLSSGASERLMGEEQRAWFLETMKRSERTFKVWGSEIAFLQKHLNLSGITLAPPELRQRVGLTAEDWDGFPNERRELLRELSSLENVVVFSGDLHCFFAGTPFDAEDPARRVVEFTIGSVSSTTWTDGIESIVQSDPSLPPMVALLAPAVGTLLTSRAPPANPHLAFQELGKNGYAVVHVSAEAMETELFMLAPADVAMPELPELASRFTSVRFRVPAGSATLERPSAAGYERWDIDQLKWVAV